MQSRPADHVDELFAIYLNTLVTLIDKHAPLCRLRITTRRSEPWFEGECRASKRLSRKLERVYRRCSHSTTARSAWQQQFHDQRRLFRRKAEDYWKSAIAEWRCDHWKLLSKLGLLLWPNEPQQPLHTAADLASQFTSKIDNVHVRTADANSAVVVHRSSKKLCNFQPVTVEEIIRLVTKAPTKHCQLDPIPTWLLKQIAVLLAPVQHFADDQQAAVC